jgi:hypothetical protein
VNLALNPFKTATEHSKSKRHDDLLQQKQDSFAHLHATTGHPTGTQTVAAGATALSPALKHRSAGIRDANKQSQHLNGEPSSEAEEAVSADSLSANEKSKALEHLMFLKEKHCGKIKGCGCADGRKQRVYTMKQESSSPTVVIESIMLSCATDAEERRHVATVDITGAFMQADMDELVYMQLEGKMVDLLLHVCPDYGRHVTIINGKRVLYVQLTKALYGTIQAALLFWRKLTSKLQERGLKLNPYDPYVANKMVDGHQCTVLWHVDDLKISHKKLLAVKGVIQKLEQEFGKESPLSVWHRKVHDYLGMRIDYTKEGKVSFTMIDYIKGMLGELPKDISSACKALLHHL